MHSCYRGGGGIIWILHKNGDEEGARCDVTTTTPTEIVRYWGGRARRSEPCRLPATRLGSGIRAGSHKSAHIYSQPWVQGATSPPPPTLPTLKIHLQPFLPTEDLSRGELRLGSGRTKGSPPMHPTPLGRGSALQCQSCHPTPVRGCKPLHQKHSFIRREWFF